MKRRLRDRLILWISVLAVSSTVSLGVPVYVNDDPNPCSPKDGTQLCPYTSIQQAITVASFGDVVMVACGIYFENLLMKDGVDVVGEGAGCTILDGSQAGTVVTFEDIGPLTELSGLTIRNGLSNQGGGIFLDNSQPVITRNIISGNAAVRNISGYFGYGGGISAYNSAPTISSNLLVGNTAELTGAGLDMYFAYPTVVNNTILGNEAYQAGLGEGFGGGIYGLFSDPTISSNIIVENSSENGGGGIDLINSSFTVEYNDVFQNLPVDWNCSDSDATACEDAGSFPFAPGNLSQDPVFEGGSDAQRFCLRSDSPALEAGPGVPPANPLDLFGRPRVLDGDFDGTAVVDLGYCESDEILQLLLGPGDGIFWDTPGNSSAVYNLYRGVLSTLVSSCASNCVYTQDPLVVTDARQECDLPTASFIDTDIPPVGECYYYLVSGEDVIEGGVGFLEDGSHRSNDNPCL